MIDLVESGGIDLPLEGETLAQELEEYKELLDVNGEYVLAMEAAIKLNQNI